MGCGGGIGDFFASFDDMVHNTVESTINQAKFYITHPLEAAEVIALTYVGVPPTVAMSTVSYANGHGSIQQVGISVIQAYGPQIGIEGMSPEMMNVVTSASSSAAIAAIQGKPLDQILSAGLSGSVKGLVMNQLSDQGFDVKSFTNKAISDAVGSASNAILNGQSIGDAIAASASKSLVAQGLKETSGALGGLWDDIYKNNETLQSLGSTFNELKSDVKSTWEQLQSNSQNGETIRDNANRMLEGFNFNNDMVNKSVAAYEEAKFNSEHIDEYLAKVAPDQFRVATLDDGEGGTYKRFQQPGTDEDGRPIWVNADIEDIRFEGQDKNQLAERQRNLAAAHANTANSSAGNAKIYADAYGSQVNAYNEFQANYVKPLADQVTEKTGRLTALNDQITSIDNQNKDLSVKLVDKVKDFKELEEKLGNELAQQIADKASSDIKTEEEARTKQLADFIANPANPAASTIQVGDTSELNPGTKITLADGSIGEVNPKGTIVPSGTAPDTTNVVYKDTSSGTVDPNTDNKLPDTTINITGVGSTIDPETGEEIPVNKKETKSFFSFGDPDLNAKYQSLFGTGSSGGTEDDLKHLFAFGSAEQKNNLLDVLEFAMVDPDALPEDKQIAKDILKTLSYKPETEKTQEEVEQPPVTPDPTKTIDPTKTATPGGGDGGGGSQSESGGGGENQTPTDTTSVPSDYVPNPDDVKNTVKNADGSTSYVMKDGTVITDGQVQDPGVSDIGKITLSGKNDPGYDTYLYLNSQPKFDSKGKQYDTPTPLSYEQWKWQSQEPELGESEEWRQQYKEWQAKNPDLKNNTAISTPGIDGGLPSATTTTTPGPGGLPSATATTTPGPGGLPSNIPSTTSGPGGLSTIATGPDTKPGTGGPGSEGPGTGDPGTGGGTGGGTGTGTGTGTGGGGTTTTVTLPKITLPSVTTATTATPATTKTPFQPATDGGIPNLTPGLTKAMNDYQLTGLSAIDTSAYEMASGGSTSAIDDLNSGKEYDPMSTSSVGYIKPGLTRANIQYALTGMPSPKMHKADGGEIMQEDLSMPEGHHPEFFSEGGLHNRYVRGDGDGTSDDVPAMLANGEFVIPADVVASLGNGDNDSGAKVLDEFLAVIRKHKRAADAKHLPPDSKGALGYLAEAHSKVRA